MDIDFEDFFNENIIVINSSRTDLYKGDHILNLASDNAERSIFELQKSLI